MNIDVNLVKRAQEGDQTAIAEIYNLTYKSAYGVARQIVANDDDACDILQDSYIAAFTKLDTLKEPEKFYGWFKRIVSNRCYNYIKKKKPDLFSQYTKEDEDGEEIEFEFADENETFAPDNALDYEETKRLLREIIDSLPEEQSLCVLMYYVQDMSIAEIAETLGVSQNTVKSRLNYGRKKIKDGVETLEKKGTKLYGISGLALIPFLRWMFTDGATNAAPNVLSKVLSSASTITTVADGVDTASTVADVVTNVSEASDSAGLGGTIVKKVGKKLATKIGAGIVATAVTATGIATVATMDNAVEIDDYVQKTIYCEGYDGYGAFPDLNNIVNVTELEKKLCGDSINEYYAYCENANVSIEDYIDIDLNLLQDGELSNGDVIEVEISVDYDAINSMEGIEKELKGDNVYTFNCTVKGLKEIVKIDLLSIIKNVGINTAFEHSIFISSDRSQYICELSDSSYEKDFGVCKITWRNQEYDGVPGTIEYLNDNNEKETRNFELCFSGVEVNNYIAGDKITITIEGLNDGDFHEYGFVIETMKKEIEPNRVFTALKDGNISNESYNILKSRVDEIAQRDIAGGVTFAGSFVVTNTLDKADCKVVLAYKNNTTGLYYAYEYTGLLIDQNDNMLNPEDKSATPVEFVHGDILTTVTTTVETYDAVKANFERDGNMLIYEINQ